MHLSQGLASNHHHNIIITYQPVYQRENINCWRKLLIGRGNLFIEMRKMIVRGNRCLGKIMNCQGEIITDKKNSNYQEITNCHGKSLLVCGNHCQGKFTLRGKYP